MHACQVFRISWQGSQIPLIQSWTLGLRKIQDFFQNEELTSSFGI